MHKKTRLAIRTNLAENIILDFVAAARVEENNRVAIYTHLLQGDKSAEKGRVIVSKAKLAYMVETMAELDIMVSTKDAKRGGYLKWYGSFSRDVVFVWER